jgi:hypothetical protein
MNMPSNLPRIGAAASWQLDLIEPTFRLSARSRRLMSVFHAALHSPKASRLAAAIDASAFSEGVDDPDNMDSIAYGLLAKCMADDVPPSRGVGVASSDTMEVFVSVIPKCEANEYAEVSDVRSLTDAERMVYSVLNYLTPTPQAEIAKRSGYTNGEYLTKILGDLFKAELVCRHARGWLKSSPA